MAACHRRHLPGQGWQHCTRQKARAVAVAGNAVETARLLQLSTSAQSPDGLGNQNGLVGQLLHAPRVRVCHGAACRVKVSMYKGIVQAGSLEHRRASRSRARGFASGYHVETVSMSPPGLTRIDVCRTSNGVLASVKRWMTTRTSPGQ